MKKKFVFLVKNLQYVNPVKQTCNHLMGEDHTPSHRMGVGVVYIFAGVLVSKIGEGYIHLFFDAMGYLIHALGTIPIIESLQHHLHKNVKNGRELPEPESLPEITGIQKIIEKV